MNYTTSDLESKRGELEDEMSYGIYAWVLEDIKRLPKPVRFQNPSGAVIWARLPSRVLNRLTS